MKKTLYGWLVAFFCAVYMGSGVMAGEAPACQVTLRTVGDVSPELVKRISAWVTGNIGPVTNGGVLKVKSVKLDGILKVVPQPGKHGLVLVLVNEIKDETRHIAHKERVVVVNTGVMKLADMKNAAALETFERRVEKEAVGALAAALGLPACPMIRCAAYAAENTFELDEKARGLCPPCVQKLEEILTRSP